MRILVDTSALVALFDRADGRHREAKTFLEGLPPVSRLILSDYALDEALTHLRYRAGHHLACALLDAVEAPAPFKLVKTDDAALEDARRIFRRYKDLKLSFTDCALLALYRRLALDAVFTFDADFAATGARSVPMTN